MIANPFKGTIWQDNIEIGIVCEFVFSSGCNGEVFHIMCEAAMLTVFELLSFILKCCSVFSGGGGKVECAYFFVVCYNFSVECLQCRVRGDKFASHDILDWFQWGFDVVVGWGCDGSGGSGFGGFGGCGVVVGCCCSRILIMWVRLSFVGVIVMGGSS